MIIEQNVNAGKAVINVGQKHIGSALRIVGTIVDDIAIEYPLVADPDIDNDSHWSALMMDGSAVVLGSAETMWVIAGTLGMIRINKPAGDNVGVAHIW